MRSLQIVGEVRLDDRKSVFFGARQGVGPTSVHKPRRFVGLVKDAKSSQIWDGTGSYMENVG
jgi:hypothetical protein